MCYRERYCRYMLVIVSNDVDMSWVVVLGIYDR